MGLTVENAGALVPGIKSKQAEVVMKTIKALRRFYHNDNGKMVVVEVGKVLVVSEIEAISWGPCLAGSLARRDGCG